MEPVRALASVPGAFTVRERQAGGNRQAADAFRRALQQQHRGDAPETDEASVRPGLQPRAADGRKESVARHVDVIA
jgi:hypothetical protein